VGGGVWGQGFMEESFAVNVGTERRKPICRMSDDQGQVSLGSCSQPYAYGHVYYKKGPACGFVQGQEDMVLNLDRNDIFG